MIVFTILCECIDNYLRYNMFEKSHREIMIANTGYVFIYFFSKDEN